MHEVYNHKLHFSQSSTIWFVKWPALILYPLHQPQPKRTAADFPLFVEIPKQITPMLSLRDLSKSDLPSPTDCTLVSFTRKAPQKKLTFYDHHPAIANGTNLFHLARAGGLAHNLYFARSASRAPFSRPPQSKSEIKTEREGAMMTEGVGEEMQILCTFTAAVY